VRIRQVKPDYWRDERLSTLSDSDRLIYIGLWMEADDAGWFRENVVEIASNLFPYQSRGPRERKVSAALDRLRALSRVVSHPCGHSQVPALPEHQRFSSPDKRVFTIQRQHDGCPPAGVPSIPAGPRGSPRFPATVRERERVGNGREDIGYTGSTSLEDAGVPRPSLLTR